MSIGCGDRRREATMSASDDFSMVMEELRKGNSDAQAEVFNRFLRRLTALASRQFDPGVRHRADPEGVVQSVYRSFFARDLKKPFDLDGWERLWGLLAVITVRKCSKKRQGFWERARFEDDWFDAIDRAPTPCEAAALTELVSWIFRDIPPGDRPIAEGILQGDTAVEIGERCGCSERTVRRLRNEIRGRLERIEPEGSRAG